ncbi:hypothetical protein G5V59_22480 [Nocardioides sp. W3-2-3]|uniref:hypothetical protein n=1 Tax=Nocardioides convexus TaxID=2712224 RepID=UPI00241867D8|nr:hypothetical protein [Nocardioides convexus]NHA01603.1 hypothetical protein [Nocardioides convexus]
MTPWDSPADQPSDQPAAADAEPEPDVTEEPEAERDTPAVPSLPPAGETEVPPAAGWVPPPPPAPFAPGVPDAPPLPVGSWEPVGSGGAPAAPAEPAAFDPDHDGQTITGAGPGVPAPTTPGIPGQPPAPAITQPVAKSARLRRPDDRGGPGGARRPGPRGPPVHLLGAADAGHRSQPPARDLLDAHRDPSGHRRRSRHRGRDRHGLHQRHRPGPARSRSRGPQAGHRRPA